MHVSFTQQKGLKIICGLEDTTWIVPYWISSKTALNYSNEQRLEQIEQNPTRIWILAYVDEKYACM